jgi:mono/diheme cytochrome c family protein
LEVERVNEKSGRSLGWLVILTFVVASSLVAQQAAKSPGANIFRTKCVLCHGSDGSGKTPLGKQLQAADLRSKDVQKLGNAELHKIIHDGQANMPPFADQLSESEIDQVLKHIRALAKAQPEKK